MNKNILLLLLLLITTITHAQKDTTKLTIAKGYYTKALDSYKNKKYILAAEFCTKAIKLAPAEPQLRSAYSLRGKIKLQQFEDYYGAIIDFSYYLSMDKEPYIYILRSQAKVGLNNNRAAIADLNIAIKLDSTYGGAYYFRAECKLTLKDYEGALLDFNKYLKLEPTEEFVYYRRSVVKSALNDHAGAIKDLTTAINIYPAGLYYYWRGIETLLATETGKDQACLDFNKAKALGYTKAYEAINEVCK